MYAIVPLKAVAIAVGAVMIGIRLPAVINPNSYRQTLKKFPRTVWPGILFLTIALVWCSIIVARANEEGMAVPKQFVFAFLVGTYLGLIVLKFDFLAVRGLAILLLLLAKVVVDSANQLDTPWRLVMTVLAYLWVIAGMWLTVSPYRLRDLLDWAGANDARCRALAASGCALGAGLIALGLLVY